MKVFFFILGMLIRNIILGNGLEGGYEICIYGEIRNI